MIPMPNDDALEQAIQTRFQCQRCGHCCKGDGVVRVGPAEVDRMAAALGLSREAFTKTYAVKIGRERWRLKDRWVEAPDADRGNGRVRRTPLPKEPWCIFLERGADGLYGCQVNAVKPDQCAAFPARWRNEDSLQTCAGLRRLTAELRAEAAAPVDHPD